MTSLVDTLYQAKYNPFKYGAFLASFYSELTDVKENLLLSPLVIPLCSHYIFRQKLLNARFGTKNKSTIWTVFQKKGELYDLQERLDNFKTLTTQSLQYCLVNDWLAIDPDELNVTILKEDEMNFEKQKDAVNLGKLFSHLSVAEIYAFLGVIP